MMTKYEKEQLAIRKKQILLASLNKDLISKLERLCVFAAANKGAIVPKPDAWENYNDQMESIIKDIYSVLEDYEMCCKGLK